MSTSGVTTADAPIVTGSEQIPASTAASVQQHSTTNTLKKVALCASAIFALAMSVTMFVAVTIITSNYVLPVMLPHFSSHYTAEFVTACVAIVAGLAPQMATIEIWERLAGKSLHEGIWCK